MCVCVSLMVDIRHECCVCVSVCYFMRDVVSVVVPPFWIRTLFSFVSLFVAVRSAHICVPI